MLLKFVSITKKEKPAKLQECKKSHNFKPTLTILFLNQKLGYDHPRLPEIRIINTDNKARNLYGLKASLAAVANIAAVQK